MSCSANYRISGENRPVPVLSWHPSVPIPHHSSTVIGWYHARLTSLTSFLSCFIKQMARYSSSNITIVLIRILIVHVWLWKIYDYYYY
jgi:hypothetical protein